MSRTAMKIPTRAHAQDKVNSSTNTTAAILHHRARDTLALTAGAVAGVGCTSR
jgi:hypothetical protein